jgi:uncharacterized membrane protein YphA (DoxX/SURF4 family)
MKTTALIARVLLGVLFLVFGLNGLFPFLPQGPAPTGVAGQFLGALTASHYLAFVFLVQLVCGVLFLVGRYVPLALVLIAPVIVNILLFHSLMNPGGIVPGAIATLLWLVVACRERSAFAGILRSKVQG